MPHTPGPWEEDNLRVWASKGDERIYIASLKFRDDTRLEYDEADANSSLIAAAPELLAACKRARSEIDGSKETCDGPLATLVILDAAIAKAEGRNQ